jgi:haloacetate dehalogenase
MFGGFTAQDIETSATSIHTLTGGSGPPLLLLHGYPQSHVVWRLVAPTLAERFSVVLADLRGYGRSGKPRSEGDHSAYSKRVMAGDMVEVMEQLGHSRFFVAGHDRGGRVAYRMALDHPDRVARLATIDIVPTYPTWRTMRAQAGLSAYHWYFLAQPHDLPERLIACDPGYFLRWTLRSWTGDRTLDAFEQEALAAYEAAFNQPETVRATCEDYRAGATVDMEDDRTDLYAGRRISCPMLALWGDRSDVPGDFVLHTWREWAVDVRGYGLPCGHFPPEEAPAETIVALRSFFES